jgi:type I restriction enzyme S subunit
MMFQVKEMGRGQPRVKLGEVCDVKCGKPMPKTDIVEGDVPVIGGGVSPMGFHNASTHEAYTPIVSQRGTAGHISRYSLKTWITPNAVIPTRKDDTAIINDDMLFYILKNEQWAIDNIVEKTAQPLLTIGNLKDIEIRIPPLTEQQTLQADFDEIRHKHAKIAEYKAKAQEAIQRLIPGASPV